MVNAHVWEALKNQSKDLFKLRFQA